MSQRPLTPNLTQPNKPAALVTGASRGIGRAIAIELAKTHSVVATYRADREAAESLRREIAAEVIQSDISIARDRDELVAALKARHGTLDLLVNNAGIAPRERRDVLEATEASFDELMATNLKGPHFLTQQIAGWMAEHRQGRIVFITSISSYTASTNRAEYCIAKAGLSMSAQLFAARLAPHGVKVFEIRPGVIRTDMIAAVEKQYDGKIAAGLVPQGRMGEPSDVARAVRAIADGLLDYSTGQVIEVAGGFGIRTL
jgi:NAD(P)-dependent dehydrogenase (short-subunit alcohol dehydrogenase family)